MWTRRAFVKQSGIALLTLGASGGPSFLSRAAAATGSGADRRKVLVAIFQRGAMDGLAAVTPLDQERWLQRLRPRLALETGRRAGDEALLDLGVGYGLHPALASLEPLWKEKELAIVHSVGSHDPTRSHFDAQDYMESGTPGDKGTSSGWLNRVCGELGHESSALRALALSRSLPRSLYGEESALAVSRLSDLEQGIRATSGARGGFEALYREASEDLLRGTARDSFEAVEMVERLRREGYRPGAGVRYPDSQLGRGLQQIALVIKAGVGLEVAFVESGGWDTHVRQGSGQGSFAQRASDLGESMAAFWRDLGSHRDDVAVLTMTEFGRTVAENGSGGTDHGHGSCLFALGTRIDGGRLSGRLESLDPDALYDGRDLPVTIDFRAVFSELAIGHLGLDRDAGRKLFPGYSGGREPLLRTS